MLFNFRFEDMQALAGQNFGAAPQAPCRQWAAIQMQEVDMEGFTTVISPLTHMFVQWVRHLYLKTERFAGQGQILLFQRGGLPAQISFLFQQTLPERGQLTPLLPQGLQGAGNRLQLSPLVVFDFRETMLIRAFFFRGKSLAHGGAAM
ncbi:MAG: hypothetical protein ACKV2V_30535 [Blastocatellia bacterium]